MVRRSANSSIWHLRIHSETTEFFYAAHLYHNLFSYPGACRTRSCQGRTPTTWSATGVCKCHGPWGTRAQMCTYIYIYILSYILCFVFFRFFGGRGQICPDGRSAGPVSCVRKWNVRSVRNRRQRSSVSWCRSETFLGKLQTRELWDPKLFHVKLPIHVPTTRRIVDESCLKKGVPGCNGLTDGHFENRKPFL